MCLFYFILDLSGYWIPPLAVAWDGVARHSLSLRSVRSTEYIVSLRSVEPDLLYTVVITKPKNPIGSGDIMSSIPEEYKSTSSLVALLAVRGDRYLQISCSLRPTHARTEYRVNKSESRVTSTCSCSYFVKELMLILGSCSIRGHPRGLSPFPLEPSLVGVLECANRKLSTSQSSTYRCSCRTTTLAA